MSKDQYSKLRLSFFSKAILICCFVFAFSSARAQYAPIPDSSFRQALIRLGYGPCFDSTYMNIDTTCAGVLAADSMDVDQCSILDITGIRYFKHLKYLNCYHNPFTFLPYLPDSLTTLVSYESLLTSLPPTLPSTLRYLNIGDNSLTNLPALPDSLVFFSCETNLLSNLPALPSTLTYFSCYGNTISSMPSLPASLTYLDCGMNMLGSLPVLPSPLTTLFCGVNQLDSLPALPQSLTRLYCNNNLLTSLPSLPDSLQRFYCFGNLLTSLPALPASLSWIDCSYNQLSFLPTLPDSLHSFSCRVNTGLYCFPQLNKIIYFSFDSTGIICLPDYPQDNVSSVPALNSVSVCGLTNPHGCPTYPDGLINVSIGDLNIYPNPTSDMLTVIVNRYDLSSPDYILTDLQGRTELSGILSQGTTNIDIRSLTDGIYLLHLSGQNTAYKVVKN
jgi:hypothetical protein